MASFIKYIDLDTAAGSAEVAESVSRDLFNREFQKLRSDLKKQESRTFQIMIGALVASFLIVLTILVEGWIFMANYNQHYLEAEKSFMQETESLKKENSETKQMLLNQADKIADRQDSLERIILEKASSKLK